MIQSEIFYILLDAYIYMYHYKKKVRLNVCVDVFVS